MLFKERGWTCLMQKDSNSSNSSFLNCMVNNPPRTCLNCGKSTSNLLHGINCPFMAEKFMEIQGVLRDHNLPLLGVGGHTIPALHQWINSLSASCSSLRSTCCLNSWRKIRVTVDHQATRIYLSNDRPDDEIIETSQ